MPIVGNDPIILCPFNKHHTIEKSRLQEHIIKCSRNYPDHFTCPYNALHRFLCKDDFTRHILSCPDTTFIVCWKYQQPTVHGDLKEVPFHDEGAYKFNFEEENWNAEYNN